MKPLLLGPSWCGSRAHFSRAEVRVWETHRGPPRLPRGASACRSPCPLAGVFRPSVKTCVQARPNLQPANPSPSSRSAGLMEKGSDLLVYMCLFRGSPGCLEGGRGESGGLIKAVLEESGGGKPAAPRGLRCGQQQRLS